VDFVIPGNDDALRAIRLFASKIADSISEGAQAATDKQVADIASAAALESEAAAAAGAGESGAEPSAPAEAEESVSMEEVLGTPARKPAAVAEAPVAAPEEEVQHAKTH